MSSPSFSKVLLEDIYKKVKEEGWHPCDAVGAFGRSLGYNRVQRQDLFEAYAYYCDHKKVYG